MSETTFADDVSRFLTDPGAAQVAAVRARVRAADNFRPDLDPKQLCAAAADQGDWPTVADTLINAMPGLFLSPSAHALLGLALAQIGHTEDAERETTLAKAATAAILGTGDGTAEHPWSVLRISDQYDALRALGKSSARQTLMQVGEERLDRHECTDDTVVWFRPPDLS